MMNRLQELRLKRKETQRQMADVMGLKNVSAYCKRELGYTPVALKEAYAAANHFEMTIEEVFFA